MVNLTDSYSIVTDGVYEEPFLLYVGVGGDVNVIMDDGNEVLFKNVRSGTFMPVFVKGVRSFGTSASGFLASKTSEVKVDSFKITIDTTQAGSASDTFVLPLYSGETYNFNVAWGDGTSETITSDTDVTHVYPSGGTYQISITGVFPRIYFNNSGDRRKLISIDNWGAIEWSNMQSAFYGCSNMNGTYTDAPDFSNVTTVRFMFFGCSSFNHQVNFDTSSVTDMFDMFFNCSSFNQSVSNFDTSNVTNMAFMFYGCSSFKQSLATFDMTSVTDVSSMLLNCDINETGTTTNYDDTLIAWAAQDLVDGLSFNGGNSKYSSTGQTARQAIIDDDNWTITDGGLI